MAGRPIVSYGFVGFVFVSVSHLCPYRYPQNQEITTKIRRLDSIIIQACIAFMELFNNGRA